jgi:cell division transport system ATP-binding protein
MAEQEKEKKKKSRKGSKDDSKYVIYLEGVNKAYSDANGVPALMDINLKIKRGEFVFIVGDSGSGKSTLIKLLLRELTADSGKVVVNDQDLTKMRHAQVAKFRRTLGVVFQDFRLLKDRNVYDNVAFAQRIVMKSEKEIRKNVPNMLSMVGLAGKYKAKPKQLSGGEQQRVALARALVNKPTILLADEPTGNLDPRNTNDIMKLLEKVNENGTTVVVVTHNRDIVNTMQKRVITLKQGVILSDEEKGAYIDD